MAFSNVFEKLGRAVFESPFGANRLAKDAPELAEVRLAVLESIKAASHRMAGKNVFPYDLVTVELLGVPEQQAPALRSDFLARHLADELKAALARSSYRHPENLAVEVATLEKLPLPGEQWIQVKCSLRQTQSPADQISGTTKLTVLQGTANNPELPLTKTRTNIGRTVEVARVSGPSRRNDLAFIGDDEQSRSVSREHAHILRQPRSGEYRIFNDRVYKGDANCALWIVRDGLSQPVHRSERGTLLQHGDEIHLGSAVLRFDAEPGAPAAQAPEQA
jgi:hypothetical protein